MRRFPGTTRARLTLIAAAILAAALVIADLSLYLGLSLSQRSQDLARLQQDARAVAAGIALRDGRIAFEGGSLPIESPGGDAFDLAVVTSAGAVAATPDQPLGRQTLIDLARPVVRSAKPLSADLYDIHGVRRRTYALPLHLGGVGGYVLVASQPDAAEQAVTAGTLFGFVLLSVLILLLGTAMVHWLVGRVLRPVHRIAALADTLSEKDLHRRLEVPAPDDELGELVHTFNRMLARLEQSFEALRRFTADASHELRAPLTLMGAEVEASLRRSRSPQEYRRVLGVLESELQGMRAMVERLLLLARADAGELKAAVEAVDVADLLHESQSRWLRLAQSRGVRLRLEAPDLGRVLADPALTGRVLDNLLDNAVRHSPRGSEVRLAAERRGAEWAMTVADAGPGIAADQREWVFERFARLDVARTRSESAGAGLGLALSVQFAALQGGRLQLVDGEAPGSVFELSLPAAPEPAEPAPFQAAFRDAGHDSRP